MKVRNIIFSGFAAAILMGTANAATTWSIASKAYVDSKVSTGLTDAQGKAISVAEALETKADADALGEGIGTGTDEKTVAEALAEKADATAVDAALGEGIGTGTDEKTVAEALAEKADASDVTALGDKVGTGDLASDFTATDVVGAINELNTEKQDALGGTSDAGKVVTATATAGTVEYTAIDSTIGTQGTNNLITSAAVKTYVDTAIDGVTGDAGSIASQIQSALGDLGTGNTTVADALADKADATDVTTLETKVGTGDLASDFTATDVVGAINELYTEKQDAITATNKLASDMVDDANQVHKFVTANDVTNLATLATLLSSYATCASSSVSGHCVLSADTTGMSWVDVTDPYITVEP